MKTLFGIVLVFGTALALVAQDAPQAPPEGRGGGRGGFGRGGGRGAPQPPAGPMPKLPDGHPDMQGFWTPPAITDIEPAMARGGRGGGGGGAAKGPDPATGFGGGGTRIVDPSDGKIPYKPEARAKQQEILQTHMAEEP